LAQRINLFGISKEKVGIMAALQERLHHWAGNDRLENLFLWFLFVQMMTHESRL